MRHKKQELILFVESNMKKRDKQTRNDSCYCPPRTHKKKKEIDCNILITERDVNHRPRL